MNQNNIKNNLRLIPKKPIEENSNKRFIRNYPRKELVPSKPKIELFSEDKKFAAKPPSKKNTNNYQRNQRRYYESQKNNNFILSKSNKTDFDKTHIFRFSKDAVYFEKYHKILPPIYKKRIIY